MNKIFFIALILITTTTLTAQNSYNLDQFVTEGGDLLKRPAKFQTKDWLYFTTIIGGTYTVMQFDEDVREIMLKNRDYVDHPFVMFGTYYGEPVVPIALGAYFLIQGAAADVKPNEKLGFELLQTYAYTALATQFFKVAIGRARPATGLNSTTFHPFQQLDNDRWSMPSGHTSSAFAMSTTLAANTDSDLLKVVYFVPAFITGFSRVYHNRHWVSDTIAGALLGYFIADFLTDVHAENERLSPSTPPAPVVSILIPL